MTLLLPAVVDPRGEMSHEELIARLQAERGTLHDGVSRHRRRNRDEIQSG